jgi:hypothetical protein
VNATLKLLDLSGDAVVNVTRLLSEVSAEVLSAVTVPPLREARPKASPEIPEREQRDDVVF